MEWTRGHAIGRGSSATVSIAASGETVFAVKSAELARSEPLQREHRVLSSLGFSPRIVKYKGNDISYENNKFMYNLFFEYAAAGSLSDETNRRGGLLGEKAIGYYTRQIVEGLVYLHSRGFAHCDIKGSNILITETGAVIADFGCAKRVVVSSSPEPMIGTPLFMAPEVARGEEQGCASDIWSLGCTVLEMATGSSPWPNAADPVSVLYRIALSGEVPEVPSCLSGEAKDFLGKCLRRDPRERWTAEQLLKHPFLDEFDSKTNQFQEPNSASPTSILDQCFWSSSDEESERSTASQSRTNLDKCPMERIRGLSEIEPSQCHSWSCDEDWITVRGEEHEPIIEIEPWR